MSGRLVHEVLLYAPDDLTPGQMLVLVSLAETARDSDRQARFHCGVDDLVHRTRGMSPGAIRNALSALVQRGLIRRVHERVHKGGKHQEYVLTRLGEHHRAARHRGSD